MGKSPKVSSFEPRRLREAVRKLEAKERVLTGEADSASVPEAPKERPGLLRRWWRMLFGGS